jgi:glucose/arabinose dehydrogenase
VYVSLLSGFPFPTGAAKVVHVSRTGQVTDVAQGLTALTDVEVGPDGALYAVQITAGFGDTGLLPNTGRVLRLAGDGSHEVVVDGLDQPFAIAFDPRGAMYVTERSNELPSLAGSGRVLRFEGSSPAAAASARRARSGRAARVHPGPRRLVLVAQGTRARARDAPSRHEDLPVRCGCQRASAPVRGGPRASALPRAAGHRILHDPHGTLARAPAILTSTPGAAPETAPLDTRPGDA